MEVFHFFIGAAGEDPVHLQYHICGACRPLESACISTPHIAAFHSLEIAEAVRKLRQLWYTVKAALNGAVIYQLRQLYHSKHKTRLPSLSSL